MTTIGDLNEESKRLEWKISHFLSLSVETDICYKSPTFSFANQSWHLTIYPNGYSGNFSVGYIGIYLHEVLANPSSKPEYSISFKTLNDKKFKKIHCRIGRGASKSISRSDLLIRKSELLPSDVLTVLCTLKCPNCIEGKSDIGTEKCAYCKDNVDSKDISFHEKKCVNKPIKCPECSEVVVLKNWYDHECQMSRAKGNISTAQCSYCKEYLDSESISLHEKKCLDKLIKCPECSDVIILRNWYAHECHAAQQKDDLSFLQDYKKVLLDGKNHDLILKVGDKELRAHQDILRARSHVFESMLKHDMTEKNSGVIDVPDCDAKAMELFLSYVYCGKVEAPDQSNMFGLYYIADKYDMKDLKEYCCAFIRKSLSTTNICEVIQLALKHSDSNLLEYATEYFMDNALDILLTVEWQTFLKDNSTLGNELIIKSFRKVKNIES